MLSKEEIKTCKEELSNYIEFMETAGDNAGWARGLKWYIDQLETDKQKLIEKLEKYKIEIESTYSQINGNYFMAQDRLNLLNEILEILKGEKE